MYTQRIILIINLSLLTLGAYLSAGLFYQFLGLHVQPVASAMFAEQSTELKTANDSKPLSYYNDILERDLFKTKKEPKASQADEKINVENLEETKLKLKLWGTVSGEPDQTYAVIEDTQKREQNLYRVGDSVQGATLKAILREKVILSVNGKDEVLAMEDLQQASGRPSLADRLPGPRPVPRGGAEPMQRVSLQRNMINEAMQDVTKLMTEIAIKPHVGEDGQPAGLALSNIKPNSIFRRMGLRNGDILKGVDGNEIRSVDDALKLYENLKSSENVNVQIERYGRERNINYSIR
jgi:general secretion pathway protein C